MSLPVRGAWIEISSPITSFWQYSSRSPCGERGLKYELKEKLCEELQSLPVRGAWIEMSVWLHPQSQRSSLPVRGAWIEISLRRHRRLLMMSLPVRGAWIEITLM